MRSELRVYVHSNPANTPADQGVFYSKRSSGPLYRWTIEPGQQEWRGSRVIQSFTILKKLSQASWVAVPLALQERLDEYYLE